MTPTYEFREAAMPFLEEAKRRAIDDLYGMDDLFSALAWMRKQPEEFRPLIEAVIRREYRNHYP